MHWLPREFTGVRSPREAQQDLLAIAGADEPLTHAHVGVDPEKGDGSRVTGLVSADLGEPPAIRIEVDGVPTFTFDPGSCRGAWLDTRDGADYYVLRLDLGWGRVDISDAYNGL